MTYELAIIGGGVNGLSTLFYALKRGIRRVILLERFFLGHDHGSSHGKVRIIRSTYPEPHYVALTQRVLTVEWPELESALETPLIHRRPGVLFGPEDGPFGAYVRAVRAAKADVETLSPEVCQSRFPYLHTEGSTVIYDRTAGIVDAAGVISGVGAFAKAAGVEIREGARVVDLTLHTSGPIQITTESEDIQAHRVIVTAGGWTEKLLPGVLPAEHLRVIRQIVGYFHIEDAPELSETGPVWAYVGKAANEMLYALHERGTLEVKIDLPFGDATFRGLRRRCASSGGDCEQGLHRRPHFSRNHGPAHRGPYRYTRRAKAWFGRIN